MSAHKLNQYYLTLWAKVILPWGGGVVGEVLNKILYTGDGGGAMSHGPTPFPLHTYNHIPFWTEKVPLWYTSY